MIRAGRTNGDGDESGVLVVEDDAPLRALIVATLRRRWLTVEVAENGEAALAQLAERSYAVITLDLMMPGISGWDVIAWLRQHPDRRPNSVIVVTAADRGVFRELDPEVVNAILIKPFDVTDFAAYVANACRRHGRDRRRKRVVGLS